MAQRKQPEEQAGETGREVKRMLYTQMAPYSNTTNSTVGMDSPILMQRYIYPFNRTYTIVPYGDFTTPGAVTDTYINISQDNWGEIFAFPAIKCYITKVDIVGEDTNITNFPRHYGLYFPHRFNVTLDLDVRSPEFHIYAKHATATDNIAYATMVNLTTREVATKNGSIVFPKRMTQFKAIKDVNQ